MSNDHTPVPAEAALQIRSRDIAIHASVEIADVLSSAESGWRSKPTRHEIQDIIAKHCDAIQPSTATTSAVEAAKEILASCSWLIVMQEKYQFVHNEGLIQNIAAIISKHFPPTETAIPAGESLSGLNDVPRLSHQEDTSMSKDYDGFRSGMLRAAEMARNEFKRASEAAKGHDCVWMGGYESACDHLSVVIAQAAVIDSVRVAGAQPDWQYHVSLLLPDEGVEDSALLKIYQVVEHELRTARANAIDEALDAAKSTLISHVAECGDAIYCNCGAQEVRNEIVAALEALKQKDQKEDVH